MMLVCLYVVFSQSYLFPPSMQSPQAVWGDYDGDGQIEIWVKPSRVSLDDIGSYVIDSDVICHLESNGIFPHEFPFLFCGTWYSGNFYHNELLIFRNQQWEPVMDFPAAGLSGKEFKPEGIYRLIATNGGKAVFKGDCLLDFLNTNPVFFLGKRKMEIFIPDLETREVNHDGAVDFQTLPLSTSRSSGLEMISFLSQGNPSSASGNCDWIPVFCEIQFPPGKKVMAWGQGDLDGNRFPELVLLVSQSENGSIFEEMDMLVFKGKGQGKWDPIPFQTLKTKQNLWQVGPVEISPQGVVLYYYKGLIRSIFKMDHYQVLSDGILNPEPKTSGWTLKDADRELIRIGWDINGDGQRDLMLRDEQGFKWYPGHSLQGFEEDEGRLLFPDRTAISHSLTLGTGDNDFVRFQSRLLGLKGEGIAPIDSDQGLQFWQFSERSDGQWQLSLVALPN